MPDLIVLRLHPSSPMAPDDFQNLLTGLTIKAFDLSFADSTTGVMLGTASGVASPHLGSTTNNQVTISSTAIMQHYLDVMQLGGTKKRFLESVATAVVVAAPPAGHPEYPVATAYDLRLEITKADGTRVIDHRLDFNVVTSSMGSPLSKSQKSYFGLGASAYVKLPATGASLDPNVAFVDLPEDGQPPPFADLVHAIDLVLADDPGAPNSSLSVAAPLTPAQAKHVAAEIVWNRQVYPAPQPDETLGADPFGALYTKPPVDPTISGESIEKARPTFEAGEGSYYGSRQAELLRMAGLVYSASAAIAEEQLSIAAERARLDVPMITGAATPTTLSTAGVALSRAGGLQPAYIVPAAVFYALAATMPPQVDTEHRFDMARLGLEAKVISELEVARDAGVIAFPAGPSTQAGPSLTVDQAARRLHALGGTQTELTELPLAAPVDALVGDWLAYAGPTEAIESAFWTGEVTTRPDAYLALVLGAVTRNYPPLIAAVTAAPFAVANVTQLIALTDQQWRDLFLGPLPPLAPPPRIALLPPWTQPGTPAQRAEAFIRGLRAFFSVTQVVPGAPPPVLGAPPPLPLSSTDTLAAFAAAYPAHSGEPSFSFANPVNRVAITDTAAEVLPGDAAAQSWLTDAVVAVCELWQITDIGAVDVRFSLVEALYSRGFTSAAQIASLTAADFRFALTGTVAYGWAGTIQAKAGGPAAGSGGGDAPFNPVNPNDGLVDCVPPAQLSPLGPVAYLRHLLDVTPRSTCDEPGDSGAQDSLMALLGGRRGDLGALHATAANLDTPLPVIDLINESLEALVAAVPGAVHDTAADEVAGHVLGAGGHDPQTFFGAVAEHSSPAWPGAVPAAYDALRADFSAPTLPYDQPLDVNRSYLGALRTNRFDTLRMFRRDITEFPLDAALEPADFRRHQWRLPVRLDLALEYLHLSPTEYAHLFTDDLVVTEVPPTVPELLALTGMSYCEFLDLVASGFLPLQRAHGDGEGQDDAAFPACEPCCIDGLRIDYGGVPDAAGLPDDADVLRRFVIFVRLWRSLQTTPCCALSMAVLADATVVLGLFDGQGHVNPDFPRQLAAFCMLRDLLGLPLDQAGVAPAGTGADRTHLLALWAGPAAGAWAWAVGVLVEGVEDAAEHRNQRLRRQPEQAKLLVDNLDPLSILAGFDPTTATDTWHARPTGTIRFAEVLLKIYVSEFTVGEVLYLFANAHLNGDDAFPLPTGSEAHDDTLELPDDEGEFGLRALRGKLLAAEVEEDPDREPTWSRIIGVLVDDLGYQPAAADDPLSLLGEHYFPSVLEREGWSVPATRRRFSTALAIGDTAPAMWNTPPNGPFRYDAAQETLSTQLPLSDGDMADNLSHLRNLGGPERDAVQALWFAPRALLAPFAFLFEDFTTAADHLITAADDNERFAYVAAAVDLFRRRGQLLSEHLAEHVGAAAEQPDGGVGPVETWRLLRTLHGDENAGLTTWEDDSGQPPDLTWPGQPTGGAFAAILGLLGTGLPGRFATAASDPAWFDLTGPFGLFGADRDHWNAPVPTVVPSMSLTLADFQLRAVSVRNGFALRNVDGEPLHGAEPFRVQWKGTLLVEETGNYEFLAGGPTPEGDEPDREHCPDHQWSVTLRRGQKSWQVLERDIPQGEPAPDFHSAPLNLRRGCYELIVTVVHAQPDFADPADVEARSTGFQLKYAGPDTGGEPHTIPHRRLYRHQVDTPLGADLQLAEGPAAYLRARYTSSLRDVRRTYQRAFKSALLVHRFRLTATPLPRDTQSELAHLLDHADTFAGRSHPRTGAIFGTHRAWFDLDLLPVDDPFRTPAGDKRASPTPKRQAALFDLWERLDDYTLLRRDTRSARERPAWRLFYEAVTRQPDDPAELVRHLGIDVGHAAQVLTYSAVPDDYSLVSPDLESEAWAIRAWRAEQWLDARERCFHPLRLSAARPHRWAAVDPAATPDAGNDNLTRFVLDGALETGTPRRYDHIRDLGDGLRVRARDALVAWLCAEDRVPLPFAPGSFARTARDLGDLVLQDVACGTEQRASRIDDAISSVQAFVQRARLGLEPGFAVGPAFAEVWDGRFATFSQWERCVHRELHRENWIGWEELRRARRVEAFQFLEDRLRRRQLTVAVPGSLEWWPGHRPPVHPGLTLLQESEWSQLAMLSPGLVPEGLDLLGTPDHDARPSWLAPFDHFGTRDGGGDDNGGDDNGGDDDGAVEFVPTGEFPADDGVAGVGHIALGAAAPQEGEPAPTDPVELARLPLWLQAAVRLGHRYVRVAAAGVPPASAGFRPCAQEAECCCVCGEQHEPLVDEYYFWLHDDEQYADLVQNADVGSSGQDETSDWHRREELPALLHHDTVPTVRLYWTRVRHGEFDPPRRTSEAVVIDPSALPAGTLPQLGFVGRLGDSLRFSVTGGVVPVGYADPAPPGFRYDLATDEAITLPQVTVAPAPAAGSFVGDLDAYPYFIYVCPGAPVEPLSPYAVADAVAGAFRADCQYEAALRWYELVVRPFAVDNAWTPCDRLPTDGGEGNGGAGADVVVLRARFADGRIRDLTCCPTVAADDDEARARAVLLHYLETILDWADALISRNSPEAFRRADVLVDAVARVLGTHPPTVYAETDDADAPTLAGFVASPSGLNPRLLALYDRVDDRAMLIHTVHNGRRRRSGQPVVDMPYFGDAVPGHCGCGCDSDCAMGCEPYRFQVLIERAAALAADARSLGAELLSAYEKGDAELLADLRATQERQLVDLSLVVRDSQLRDADWQLQALEKAKEGAQSRLRYYQNLIAAGLISGESGYQTLTTVSAGSRTAGNVSEAIAQAVGVTPDFWSGVAGIAGTPLAFMQMPMGVKLASGFATAARILNAIAEIASTEAGRSLTEAGWDRREQDWRQQVDVITIEIDQIERQILGAERRRHQARHELDNTRAQAENAAAVQDYLRDKFTSHELYLFLQRETAALYAQGYSLAKEAAEQAERAFNFELGHLRRSFLPEDGWDSLHEGLLAGDRLVHSLRRLEKAYRDHNCREYELVKHVSLRQAFPLQLLQLQATGATEIELPEWLFDSDYPGQYLRRIKSVSLSIPCVVGPYTGVHCRLTLLSSSTRIDPTLGTDPVVCCDDAGTPDGCGCATRRGAYDARPGDPRIVHTYAATQAIATSTGQNDAGLFELSFRDERYLPFEFSGAVSRWRLELPPETNAFDLDTVSDVVMHLSYTAREGGEVLAEAAAGSARHRLPGDGLRLVDLRRDLPDVWRSLETWRHGHGDYRRSFDLSITEALFPYVPMMRRVSSVTSVQLLIEAPCAEPGSNHVVRFFPHGHHHDERHWGHGSGRDEECGCDRIDVVCVAGQDYQGLFRGEIDLSEVGPLGPIPDGTRHAGSSGEDTSFGCVELPDDLGEICDAYVVLTYCANRNRGCVSDTPCPCATCSCSRHCTFCSGSGHCGGGCHGLA